MLSEEEGKFLVKLARESIETLSEEAEEDIMKLIDEIKSENL